MLNYIYATIGKLTLPKDAVIHQDGKYYLPAGHISEHVELKGYENCYILLRQNWWGCWYKANSILISNYMYSSVKPTMF